MRTLPREWWEGRLGHITRMHKNKIIMISNKMAGSTQSSTVDKPMDNSNEELNTAKRRKCRVSTFGLATGCPPYYIEGHAVAIVPSMCPEYIHIHTLIASLYSSATTDALIFTWICVIGHMYRHCDRNEVEY